MKNKYVPFLTMVITTLLTFTLFQFTFQKRNTTYKKPGVKVALEYLSIARSYPEKDIPEKGIFEAFTQQQTQRSQRQLLKQNNLNEDNNWQSMGPNRHGGRTLDIAFNPQNPNTVYAGSASGGLWRSYTGGECENAWELINTGFPVLGVSSIAVSPDDSNTIYIGTGEVYGHPDTFPGVLGERLNRGSYGIGILKSEDGGQTWKKSLDWTTFQRRGVQMVKIDPTDTRIVWAATTEGTFKSIDDGDTFNPVHNVVMATDIVIHNTNSDTVFVACGGMGSEGHGIYTTYDGGLSWQKAIIPGVSTFGGKVRLGGSKSNPNIVYATFGSSDGGFIDWINGEETKSWLVKTLNSGASWFVVSTQDFASFQSWYSHDVDVNPTDPSNVWVGGQRFNPYVSTNGGNNLMTATSFGLFARDESVPEGFSFSYVDYHVIKHHPTNPDIIYFGNDGGIYRTINGGQTIRNLNKGYNTIQFYNGTVSSDTDSNLVIGGSQDLPTFIHEGNNEWRRVFFGDGAWAAIDQTNNDIIYASSFWLNIGRSTDGGLTFEDISPVQLNEQSNFIAPLILSPADNKTLFAGADVVYKSINDGVSWTRSMPLDNNFLIALAGSHQNADVLYAVTSPNVLRARIFRSDDGAINWQEITGDLPDKFATDITVDPNDDQSIFVTFGGFVNSHLFRSNDGGNTWVDIGSGLPDVPTWAVTIDPEIPEHIFVGNDIGVYYSPDNGFTWMPHMEGLPDAVLAMDLHISRSNRMLRVATHGNGFYESKLPASDITSVTESEEAIPVGFVLEQNYPNPFNPETNIKYYLEKGERVILTIYNSQGEEVRTLVETWQPSGWHSTVWNGKNNIGNSVSSGIYFYELSSANKSISKKMVLLK